MAWRWLVAAVMVVAGSVGCLQPGEVVCADGALCPAGTVCVSGGCAAPAQVEACDGLADGATCDVPGFGVGTCVDGACRASTCGDGVLDVGEACDDGNGRDGDGCARDCLSNETCGNGVRDAGEECDDGNQVDGDGCQGLCTAPRCGDAIVDAGEACDDGNQADGDGCQATCLSDETCGNGFVDVAAGEECDQGSGLSHDGCASACLGETASFARVEPPMMARELHGLAPLGGRLILFGGEQRTADGNGYATDDTWAFDGVSWARLAPAHHPAARMSHALVYDAAQDRLILFGGSDEPGGNGRRFDDTWVFDGVDWTELAPATRPPPRAQHYATYDTARARMVVFGGRDAGVTYRDTWELVGDEWVEVSTGTAPPATGYRALAYFPPGGTSVLFGGNPASETWLYDGTTWVNTNLPANKQPPAHTWPALAFDAGLGALVLAGGRDDVFDTWLWTGQWTEVPLPAPAPIARYQATIASLPDGPVLFGGDSVDASGSLGDTWRFKDHQWVEITPPTSPSERYGVTYAYDQARGVMVAFGGAGPDPRAKQETWEFDGAVWQRRAPLVAPPPRQDHMMAYDPVRAQVIIFGGYGDAGPRDDAWAYDGTTWSPLTFAVRPSGRTGAQLVGNPAAGHVLLVGGNDSEGWLDDTWALTAGGWSQLADFPGGVIGGAMAAYDARRQRVVLFGGTAPEELFDWTWEHDGATWTQLAPATSPPGRYIGTAAYDGSRGRVAVFGGNAGLSFLNDYWEFDGTTWARRPTAQAPSARELHGMAYHDRAQRMVIGFGLDSGTFTDDTWTFAFDNAGASAERCTDATADDDLDGLAGCDDPDCWGRCAPGCSPGVTCAADAPRCGDGVCAAALEDYVLCPTDCAAP